MKEQFDTKLVTSFTLWLDNRITVGGEAFLNHTGLLYRQTDPSSPFTNIYASPYKSWVYDSCLTGGNIPSGIYNSSGQFLTRTSGISFDFENGRVLSSGNWGNNLSGTYSSKEYNVYFSTEEVTSFFLDEVYRANNDLTYSATGVKPYHFVAPCLIVTNSFAENKPFAFGGQDVSKRTLRVYAISNNNYKQEALNSLLIDSTRMGFPLVNNADTPLNGYKDLKTGYYNYCNLKSQYGCSDVFISNVYSYKISDKANRTSNLLLSFFEFDLESVRYPRA